MAAKCTALTWARLLERGRAAPRPASTRTDKLSFVIPHLTTRESVAVVMEPATPLEQFEAVLSGELEGKLPRAVTIENHMVYFVSNAWLDVKERLQWASAACALTGTVLGASILYWPASKDIGDKVRYWLIAFFMFIAVLFLAYTAHKDKVLEKRTKRLRLMGDGKDLSRSDVASMAAGVAAPQAAEMIPD